MAGVCVFDLDNTLGDFRVVDFFGMLFEPKCMLGYPNISPERAEELKNEINAYKNTTKEQLVLLRDSFEKALAQDGYSSKMLRPKIKDILAPLVNEYTKGNIVGFIIYSNNANLYALEYAGRAIEQIFKKPNLFIKYLDRNSMERDEFDSKDGEGYRTKTVATIKKILPILENKKILFMDDLLHDDFVKNDVSYVHVPRYTSNIQDDELNNIWSEFEMIFDSYENFKDIFFNLYHIKNYLHYNSMEDIKNAYLNYSKMNVNDEFHKSEFNENMTHIKNNIFSYVNSLNVKGGKRKTRRFRKSRKKAHKKKYELEE